MEKVKLTDVIGPASKHMYKFRLVKADVEKLELKSVYIILCEGIDS